MRKEMRHSSSTYIIIMQEPSAASEGEDEKSKFTGAIGRNLLFLLRKVREKKDDAAPQVLQST